MKTFITQVVDTCVRGEKIVMTNGCFDILYSDHMIYLEKAKLLDHKLIITVNDDNSIRCLKGLKRPINKLQECMIILTVLNSVD